MTEFTHMDHTGDTLQVRPLLLGKERGLLFEIIPSRGGRACVFVPESIVREKLWNIETPLQVAESASIRWRIGEHTIEIEGRTAGEVADALRVALGDGADTGLLDELAEMLDCDPAELLGELRQVIERRDEAEVKAQAWRKRAEDLGQRPTTAQLQQAEHAATKAQVDLKALRATVEADHNGIRELRRALAQQGLNGMSTATLPEIAETIARLGRENNSLREVNSRGGMADDLQRQTREQQQEIEALRRIDEQLQKAIERERDLRKAAEGGRDAWIERHRHEVGLKVAAQGELMTTRTQVKAQQADLGAAQREIASLKGEVQRLTTNVADADRETRQVVESLRLLRAQLQQAESTAAGAVQSRAKAEEAYILQANAAQRHLGMLRTARAALSSMRDQFTDDDGAPESCTLSVEMVTPLVDSIDEALAATA